MHSILKIVRYTGILGLRLIPVQCMQAVRQMPIQAGTVQLLAGVNNKLCVHICKRSFYRMLNAVFNRPDENRIKEVGPERAAAEWLLRCGAHIRWVGGTKFFTDYNSLPQTSSSNHIEEINCDEAAVMDIGFVHLEGLKCVKKMRFNHCPYFEDEAIAQVTRVKDSLESLEITSCGDLTEQGLSALTQLHKLKSLYMRDLPAVRDKQGLLSQLQRALPRCNITYVDAEG